MTRVASASLGIVSSAWALACAPGVNSPSPSTSTRAMDVASESRASSGTAGAGELGDALVEGRIVDLSGESVVDVLVTVSDDYCVPDRSAVDGRFTVEKVRDGSKRLITYGETASNGIFASIVVAIAVEGNTTLTDTVRLPRLDEVHALDLDSDELQTIVVSEGLELDIEPGSLTLAPFFEPELRVARVPVTDAPAFVPGGVELHDLFVLHPIRSTFDPPASVRFPPDPELTPGASATFYSLDYDTGTLTPVAEGTVNAEGAPITNPGQGIPELTWIGVAIGD